MNVRNYCLSPISRICFLLLFTGLCRAGAVQAQTAMNEAMPPAQKDPPATAVPRKASTDKKSDSGHVYRMNYIRSIGFTAAALGANLWATPNLTKDKKPLTDAELQSLNPNIFNDLDKWALRQKTTDREKINVLSDRILTVTLLSATGLLADKAIRKDWARIIAMYFETSGFTFSVYNFSPFGPLFNDKIRPVAYYPNFPIEARREGNSRNSLYSGHVANAAASTFFMAKVYSDYHPELGGKKYLLYGLASVPPFLIGYLRVKSLFHFPSDCLIGYVIGAACGIIIPETHRIKDRKNLQLGVSTTSDGPGLALKWKFDNKTK